MGYRPRRLRQNKKRPSKTIFLVEAAGILSFGAKRTAWCYAPCSPLSSAPRSNRHSLACKLAYRLASLDYRTGWVLVLTAKKQQTTAWVICCFWSKRRDSNPRSPVPEASRSSLLTTFIYFLVLSSPKTALSDALVRTVSTQSKSVDGQRCGHRAISVKLKARKLNRIYPVLSFPSAISIPYISILVNRPF